MQFNIQDKVMNKYKKVSSQMFTEILRIDEITNVWKPFNVSTQKKNKN
jgi:hypothetical protein